MMMDEYLHSSALFFIPALLLFLLLPIVLTAIQRLAIARLAKKYDCQKPISYPHSPFFGGLDYVFTNAINIRKHKFAEGAAHFFNRFGLTWSALVFGKYVVHSVDPENLRAVMATQSEDFAIIPARKKLVETVFGEGIFSTNGHEWARSRSMIRHGLGKMTYDDSIYEKHASHLIKEALASNDSNSNFYDQAYHFTANLTNDLYFGESTRSSDPLKAQRSKDLLDSYTKLGQTARSLTLFGKRIPYVIKLLYPDNQSNKHSVDSYIDNLLQEAKTEAKIPGMEDTQRQITLTQALAEKTEDMPRARAEILNLMLAGNETSAIGLSELIWNLSRHPYVWQKLRSEAAEVLGGRVPSLGDLKKLPYLKACINESLRVRPTLSVHGRYTTLDTTLPRGGGPDGRSPIVMPRNSYFIYSHYALNRDPSVFGPDVEIFRPERWFGSQTTSSKPTTPSFNPTSGSPAEPEVPVSQAESLKYDRYAFLPFLAGARACPGEKLGTTVVAYATVRLVQAFERCGTSDEKPWEEARAFSFYNRNGVGVRFVPAGEKVGE